MCLLKLPNISPKSVIFQLAFLLLSASISNAENIAENLDKSHSHEGDTREIDILHSCAPLGLDKPEDAESFAVFPAVSENKFAALLQSTSYPAELESVWISGPSDNRLDVVFLGDGYRDDEQDLFNQHVEEIKIALFNEEPFKSFKDLINLHRLNIVSQDSGISNDPSLGIEKNTALNSSLWCFGLARSLCVDVNTVRDYANINAPFHDQIVVVSNSNSYGGLAYQHGNIATLTGKHFLSRELFLHEFGHSFGNLADEYDGASFTSHYSGGEISRANVSILDESEMTSSSSKWINWLNINPKTIPGAENSIGVFEGGYNYSKGVFRPSFNSKMRSLGQPYNLPSMEALVLKLYDHVDLIEEIFPIRKDVSVWEDIFVDIVSSSGAKLEINWYLDDVLVLENSLVFDSDKILKKASKFNPGIYELKLEVIDRSAFVRNEKARTQFMRDSNVWQIVISPDDLNDITSQSSPIQNSLKCVFPNSFLGQINIAALVNEENRNLAGTASFRDSLGNVISQRRVVLKANQKLDLSIHDFGLEPDSTGTFCFDSSAGSWSGGLSLYAPSSVKNNGFDFALYNPFSEANNYPAVLPLNTFTLVNGERGSYNWIRLLDGTPGDGAPLKGKLKVYNASGKLLYLQSLNINDGGRLDIAGHEILSQNEVGLAEFTSSNGSNFYFEVSRYFPRASGGFYSASSMQKNEFTTELMAAAFKRTSRELPVVEILNPNNLESEVLVVLRDKSGLILSSEVINLSPKSSFHYILANSKITIGQEGTIELKSTRKIASRLMNYTDDSAGYIYSSVAKEMNLVAANKKITQFNTFLNQKNTLRVINRSDEIQKVDVIVYDYLLRPLFQTSLNLKSFGTSTLPLDLAADTYGSIVLSGSENFEAETIVNLDNSYIMQLSAQ